MDNENLSKKLTTPTPLKCPKCNDVFDRMSSNTGTPQIGPGTLALCSACGCISIVNADAKSLSRARKGDLEYIVNKGIMSPKEMSMMTRGSERIKYLRSKGETVNIPALVQWLNSHNN
jgi:hypothetical protein